MYAWQHLENHDKLELSSPTFGATYFTSEPLFAQQIYVYSSSK